MKSVEQTHEGHEKAAPERGRISGWLGLVRGRSKDLTPEIATRAYQIYQNRVRDYNQQDQDWLEAEEETRNLISRPRRVIELVVKIAITLGFLFAFYRHDIWAITEKIFSAQLDMLFLPIFFVILMLWKLPDLQARFSKGASPENQFDRENEARKTLAQIIGGAFLLAGLYSSIRTLDLQRASLNLQQEEQITDRFTKAIDQLGSMQPGKAVDAEGKPKVNLEVRLGGIYALERIAHDSPKDKATIAEVLTAYVRENSPLINGLEPAGAKLSIGEKSMPPSPSLDSSRPRADIQAILRVIGRSRSMHLLPRGIALDLSNTRLTGADLSDENLSGVDLQNADLRNADLRGAILNGVNFDGADLSGAQLRGADIEEADLQGVRGLTQDQVNGIRGSPLTKLGKEFARPASWKIP